MVPSIQDLTKEEKRQLMEALWEDFTRTAEEFESPSWHGDVLRERQELTSSGLNPATDWDQAKATLLKKVRENPDSR